MKYIKTFESHRQVNEEFVGDLFKKMKKMATDKISMQFSKMFGSSKEADAVMEEYKKEIITKQNEKMKSLRAFGEYIKVSEESGEVDEKKMEELKNNFEESKVNFDKQVKLSKEKFDIKLNEITSEEKNKKIKNYIKLKKIEMQQELLNRELNLIHEDIGLSDEQIKNSPEMQAVIKKAQEAAKANAQMEKKEREILKQKGEVVVEFDIEEAKRNPDEYQWEESPWVKDPTKIEKGAKILYFSKTNSANDENYEGTKATVITVREEGEGAHQKVEVRTGDDPDEGFPISMGKIISVEEYDNKNSEKSEEETPEEGAEETNVDTDVKV